MSPPASSADELPIEHESPGREHSDDRESPDPAAVRGFVTTAVTLAVLLVATMLTQFPADLVGNWVSKQGRTYQAVWPQGWAFFSGVDQAEFVVVYYIDDTGKPVAITAPAASRGHLWGVSRRVNGEIVETEAIGRLVPREYWNDCGATDLLSCRTLLADAPVFRLSAPLRVFDGCGPVVVAVERASAGPRRDVVRVASVEVACGG